MGAGFEGEPEVDELGVSGGGGGAEGKLVHGANVSTICPIIVHIPIV